MPDVRELLRHAVATLGYRAARALHDPPASFSQTRACPTGRTATEVVAHMADIMEWADRCVAGSTEWKTANSGSLSAETERFFAALAQLDGSLAVKPLDFPVDRLFQGPIADALTHVGQLAILRRLAGSPVKGENYFVADVRIGSVGIDQASPRMQFD